MPTVDPERFPEVQIHSSAFVDEPCEIGAGTRIWHFCHVMASCRIGRNCNLGQNVVVSPEVVLGENVKVQNNVSLYTGVVLEDDVFCGPSVVFTNVTTPRSEISRRDQYERTLVCQGATLGANATILCGHRIGSYAFVAAGAVVTQDVANHALVLGVPARRVGWMCRCGMRLPEAGADPRLVCGACGNVYEERDGAVVAVRES